MTTTTEVPTLDVISEMALKDWRSLNHVLTALSEEQLLDMIAYERVNRRRLDIAVRVHQRYCNVRTARERGELMTELGEKNEDR